MHNVYVYIDMIINHTETVIINIVKLIEKYFQEQKGMMVDFSPWHFQFEMFQYEADRFLVSQIIKPLVQTIRSSFAAGESCCTRWCLERSLVAVRRDRVLDE